MYAPVSNNDDHHANVELVEENNIHSKTFCRIPPQRMAPINCVRIMGFFMTLIVFALIILTCYPMYWILTGEHTHDYVFMVVFNILVGLVLVSYGQVMLTDPGTVPEEWETAVRQLSRPPYKKCTRCSMYKPPRSHYCSVTKRIVLNMDHFCPWVNNTVGYFNRKFFVLFLVYTALACWCACTIIGFKFINDEIEGLTFDTTKPEKDKPPEGADAFVSMAIFHVMTLMAMIIDGCFALSLSIFGAVHIYMAMVNKTTIESDASTQKYNLGKVENLESVFGKQKWTWFIPLYFNGPSGNGVQWRLANGNWTGFVENGDLNEEQHVEIDIELSQIPTKYE